MKHLALLVLQLALLVQQLALLVQQLALLVQQLLLRRPGDDCPECSEARRSQPTTLN